MGTAMNAPLYFNLLVVCRYVVSIYICIQYANIIPRAYIEHVHIHI